MERGSGVQAWGAFTGIYAIRASAIFDLFTNDQSNVHYFAAWGNANITMETEIRLPAKTLK